MYIYYHGYAVLSFKSSEFKCLLLLRIVCSFHSSNIKKNETQKLIVLYSISNKRIFSLNKPDNKHDFSVLFIIEKKLFNEF